MSSARAGQISGAVFLIDLGALALTGLWWPGIMFVLAASAFAQALVQGRGWAGAQGALWLAGIGVLAATDLWWPGIVLLVGLSMLAGMVMGAPGVSRSGRREQIRARRAARRSAGADSQPVAEPPVPPAREVRAAADRARSRRTGERLDQAKEYRARMQELVESQEGMMRTNLQATVAEMDKGIDLMARLSTRLDTYQDNPLIRRDLEAVPRAIKELEARLEQEADARVREEMTRTLESRRAQLDQLRSLENAMKRADIRLDSMLASMGTVYAQMQMITSRDLEGGRAQRLHQDVADQVIAMQDTIDAMDEVYNQSAIG